MVEDTALQPNDPQVPLCTGSQFGRPDNVKTRFKSFRVLDPDVILGARQKLLRRVPRLTKQTLLTFGEQKNN
ncbi:hypothetical protein J6590_037034 [Homalodisca vitripennis]|nr:hypothetical protein J6590_037034 [Homalodisca vitripennis]